MEKDHAVAFKKKPHDGNMRSIAFAYGSAAHFSIPRFALAHVDGAGRRYDPVRAAAASDGRCMPFYFKSPNACFQLPSQLYVLGPCFFYFAQDKYWIELIERGASFKGVAANLP